MTEKYILIWLMKKQNNYSFVKKSCTGIHLGTGFFLLAKNNNYFKMANRILKRNLKRSFDYGII